MESREYYPFYEKVVKHDLPILIHGTHWECSPLMDMEHSWRFLHVFGWDYDGTQAVWRLIFGGVLDRFPTLKIVTHHLGNYIPFFKRRIEANVNKFLKDQLPKPITEYWGNIYGDTAVDGTVGAIPCGYAFFGSERMLYGSDYPFGAEAGEDFIRENLACVKGMYIPPGGKGENPGRECQEDAEDRTEDCGALRSSYFDVFRTALRGIRGASEALCRLLCGFAVTRLK